MGGIRVTGRDIIHMRGDSGVLIVPLYINGEPYTMQDGDSAVLTVKRNPKADTMLLQKEMTEGVFQILPEDTKELKPGNYVYDIQVTLADGQVSTVALGKYKLLRDITTEVDDDDPW